MKRFAARLTDTDNPDVIVQDAYEWRQFKADNRGREISLEVRVGGKRSTAANSYLWGVCYPNILQAMKHSGVRITAEQLHGYFCTEFLAVTLPDANGEVVTLPGSSKGLSPKDFGEFIEAIVMWSWEKLNITIPAPGEQTTLELNAHA